jgi:hypothetical protein
MLECVISPFFSIGIPRASPSERTTQAGEALDSDVAIDT